jgi:hypothetical protein
MERLHTVEKAGELLGDLNRDDVCRLIRQGKLQAKKRIVRGRGVRPRYVITQTAIENYIRELPNAVDDVLPVRRRPRHGVLAGVEEFV